MRKFNGASDELTGSFAVLADHTGGFTISVWYQAVAVTGSSTGRLFGSGDGTTNFIVQHQGDELLVVITDGTGDFTGNGITVPDASDLHHYAWRYNGIEWSAWLDGDKTVIDTNVEDGAFGTIPANFFVGHFDGADHSNGYIGEIAVFQFGLRAEYMAELAAGVAADQFGAAVYFPLRGNSSPEYNYADVSQTLTVTGTTQTAHPEIVTALGAPSHEPCWVLDVYDADDQSLLFRCASRDLYEPNDEDTLGAVYPNGILDPESIRVSKRMPRGGGVVTFDDVTLRIAPQHLDDFDVTFDFRGAGVKLRKYCRHCHALRTSFTGIVSGSPLQAVGAFELPCSGNSPELQELIPRLTIGAEQSTRAEFFKESDDTLRPFDLEAPIPIACGSGGLCTPPYIERDVDESPGGAVYLLSWGTNVHVDAGFGDIDTNAPGLERLVEWENVSGDGTPATDHSPTYVTTTTFTVTGEGLDAWYVPGMPVRFLDGDDDVTARTTVTDYTSGTVTVTDAVVPATILRMEIVTEFILERDRWKYVGAGGTTFMTTALHPGEPAFVPVYTLTTVSRQGPVQLINEILSDPDWGLNQDVDGDDVLDAVEETGDAGIAGAVPSVLGGDRLRRTAESILNELCAWRGVQIWKDDQQLYHVSVDRPPTTLNTALELGPGTANNIASLPVWWYTPLNEAVSTIRHRYGKGGRVRRGSSLEEGDYHFANLMTVTGKGQRLEIVSDFLRNHEEAARVTYYIGQRLIRSDHHGRFTVNQDGWRLHEGRSLVDVTITVEGSEIDETYRVSDVVETLATYDIEVEGPYAVDIFETDIGAINAVVTQPDGLGNPDDRSLSLSDSANLIPASDFIAGLGAEPDYSETTISAGAAVLPGWSVVQTVGGVTAIDCVDDVETVGGAYLHIETGAGVMDDSNAPTFLVPRFPGGNSSAAVTGGQTYLFSAYIDCDAGPPGMRVVFVWLGGVGTTDPPQVRLVPGDVNTMGWRRFYWMDRAPNDATSVVMRLRLIEPSASYNIDAVKLERLSRGNHRPTPYSRHPTFGFQSDQSRPADWNTRATGQPTAGTTTTHEDSGEITLGGASELLMSVPAGDWLNFTGLIFAGFAVTGCHHWEIRADSSSGQTLARNLPITDNTQITSAHRAFSGPFTRSAAFNVYAVPLDEDDQIVTFTGGKVRVLAHGYTYAAPTR